MGSYAPHHAGDVSIPAQKSKTGRHLLCFRSASSQCCLARNPIVLHWYHSPSMQLTTAMTALPPSPTARLVTYDAKCCGSSMCRAYGSPQIDQRLLKQPNKAGINRNGDNHHHRNCHVVTCVFLNAIRLISDRIVVLCTMI